MYCQINFRYHKFKTEPPRKKHFITLPSSLIHFNHTIYFVEFLICINSWEQGFLCSEWMMVHSLSTKVMSDSTKTFTRMTQPCLNPIRDPQLTFHLTVHHHIRVRITCVFDYKDGLYHFIVLGAGNYNFASHVLEALGEMTDKIAWYVNFNDHSASVAYGESDFICGRGIFSENQVSLQIQIFSASESTL